MSVRNGLAYVDFRPPTDDELEDPEIPRIHLTSPHKWDPRCMDSTPSEDWFDQQPDDILDDPVAYAAVFLASDEAAFITGQVLGVDGGMAMM